MLRPLYCCVLRLHPPGFRRRFAGEMLSIFDEKPAAARLLADGLLSLLRQWTLRPESWHEISPAQQPAPDGVPTFHTLDPFRPRAGAVIHGLVLSTAVFGVTCFAIRYSWIHILHVRIREVQSDSARSFQSESGPGADARFEKRTGPLRAAKKAPLELPAPSHSALDVPTPARLPAITVHNQDSVTQSSAANQPQSQVHSAAQSALGIAGHPKHGLAANLARPGNLHSDSPQSLEQRSGLPHPLEPQPKTQDAIRETLPIAIENLSLDAAERQRVIHGAVANLTKYYIDRDVAQKMADALMAHEKNGDDDAAADAEVFADLLTRQMAAVSHDPYVIMSYSAVPSADNPRAPTSDDLARYRKEMKENNCAIETAKILPHNIGYFKFNAFPDAAICAKTVTAAMTSLIHTDAIIFDLRDNRGGYANMVEFLATYLFDHPTHLNDFYDRSENSTEQSWTLPPVPGNRLADKPAFVLTSPTTFSAAEGFAYDLKMLKRATLVGETTSGRGHLGKGHRIDDRFTIRIPGIRVINPISRTNWEGTGVEPDVKVRAADALATAEKLAEKMLPPN